MGEYTFLTASALSRIAEGEAQTGLVGGTVFACCGALSGSASFGRGASRSSRFPAYHSAVRGLHPFIVFFLVVRHLVPCLEFIFVRAGCDVDEYLHTSVIRLYESELLVWSISQDGARFLWRGITLSIGSGISF